MKTIVIFGANGFLGRYLCRHFARQGREVVAVARKREGWSGDGLLLEWDGESPGPWTLALEGADVVINLAGRSVNCRYDRVNRREILESRVRSTEAIGKAIRECKVPPRLWINSSTATWYRHATDRPQDEWRGERGEGFSCEVAQAWEEAFFHDPTPAATRKVAIRTGIVLANEPGTAFDVLSKLTRFGLGGTQGKGTQRISWIHMDDYLRAINHLIDDILLQGVVNLTSLHFPTNREWMGAFRDAVGMPIGLPASRWMLEIGAWLLRTETELVNKSRWAAPQRLWEDGFRWRWKDAGEAIANLTARRGLEGFFELAPRRSVGARAWLPAADRR
ncbi:MAG: TIGR01777 family oxidoreductase [Akkermansiaceae bacterium]|nr:TIGR01777 family oxidoreductase [Akkermansiaceae bacterium]